MPHFRKRPVVVEARRFVPLDEFEDWRVFRQRANELATWCSGILRLPLNETAYIVILSVNSDSAQLAHQGDWVVRGVEGEFRSVRGDIFTETYEEVVDERSLAPA